jgi:hypothetical protein
MFRFTIRELVLVTVIVALGVGWWLDHRAVTSENLGLSRTKAHAVQAAEKFYGHLQVLSAEQRTLKQTLSDREAELAGLRKSMGRDAQATSTAADP